MIPHKDKNREVKRIPNPVPIDLENIPEVDSTKNDRAALYQPYPSKFGNGQLNTTPAGIILP